MVERCPAIFTGDQDSDGDHSFCHLDFGIPLEHAGAVLPSSLHLNQASIKIIIEGEVVMEGIKDLPTDVCILFGLAYALYLNYPKSTKNTFQFTQQTSTSHIGPQ